MKLQDWEQPVFISCFIAVMKYLDKSNLRGERSIVADYLWSSSSKAGKGVTLHPSSGRKQDDERHTHLTFSFLSSSGPSPEKQIHPLLGRLFPPQLIPHRHAPELNNPSMVCLKACLIDDSGSQQVAIKFNHHRAPQERWGRESGTDRLRRKGKQRNVGGVKGAILTDQVLVELVLGGRTGRKLHLAILSSAHFESQRRLLSK